MSCPDAYMAWAGGIFVALGLLALLFGFFRGLLDARARDGSAMLVFVCGMAAVALGAWIIRIC